MGRGYTHAVSVGRERQSAQRGRDFRPIFATRVRRRLSLIQGTTFRLYCLGLHRFGSRGSFGPGEPILAPKKSTDWGSTFDALGFTINSRTMRISSPREKANDIKRLMLHQWPLSRRRASARDVLRVAGKLWNLTYEVRAGRYFAWRLLQLTGIHDASARNKQNRMIKLGREFHADLLFW